MKNLTLLGTGVAIAAAAATAGIAGVAGASPLPSGGANHAVFVQTDNTAGNQVVAYHRSNDGTLTLAHTYNTGGKGGVLSGSAVDHLASQGSLTYDSAHALLFAVNAGSNSVSVFSVDGDRLALRQVIRSGGMFPVSVAVHGDLVYVLNAENGGAIQGFSVHDSHLVRLAGSNRSLGLDPTATPQFTNTPGQVAFSPNGSHLIVTTKANGNDIDVFGIGLSGRPSATAVVNSEPGTVPFGVSFDQGGYLVVAEAGTNALATFGLNHDGTLTTIDTVPTGQSATCWVAPARGFFFASNAGSANVTGFSSSAAGQLTLLGNTSTNAGTVDASASANGRFLYVQTGATGVVDGYRVHDNGSLTPVGSVTAANAIGGEGIVAA